MLVADHRRRRYQGSACCRGRPTAVVGIDLVAMCVNDLVVQGAQPLFFLDYFATGELDARRGRRGRGRHRRRLPASRLRPDRRRNRGDAGPLSPRRVRSRRVRRRRRRAGPILPRPDLSQAGDVVLGLASSGVHANGFSLVRLVLREQGLSSPTPAHGSRRQTLGEALLAPTRIYVASCLAAIAAGGVKALAHITGGGLVENPPRVLGPMARCCISISARGRCRRCSRGWRRPAGSARSSCCAPSTAASGMILVVDPPGSSVVARRARGARRDGSTRRRHRRVRRPRATSSSPGWRAHGPRRASRVLISGGGSNLQALLDATAAPGSQRRDRARRQQLSRAPSASNGRGAPVSPPSVVDHRASPTEPPSTRRSTDAPARAAASNWSASPASCAS